MKKLKLFAPCLALAILPQVCLVACKDEPVETITINLEAGVGGSVSPQCVIQKGAKYSQVKNKLKNCTSPDQYNMLGGWYDEDGQLIDNNYKFNEDGQTITAKFVVDSLKYDYDTSSKTAIVTGYEGGLPGHMIMPDTTEYKNEEYHITGIKDYAFIKCEDLNIVEIGKFVESIGQHSFGECTNIKYVIIPDSVTFIGTYAFDHCSSISDQSGPNDTPGFQFDGAISDWRIIKRQEGWHNWVSASRVQCDHDSCGLDDIETGLLYSYDDTNRIATVTGIGDKDETTSIDIPEITAHQGKTYDVEAIRANAFDECTALESVSIPKTINSIDSSAFFECSSLKNITVNQDNKTYTSQDSEGQPCNCIIENKTGTLIVGSSTTTIPNGAVTKIGEKSFYARSALTSITIPSSITSIGNDAFSCCSSLETITVDSNNEKYTSQNYSKTQECNCIIEIDTKKLIVGCQRTSIPDDNSVTRIEADAFNKCTSLTSIVIPNSVTSIGDNAFEDCSALTDTSGTGGQPGFQYAGDISSWRNITDRGEDWHKNTPATEILCNGEKTTLDDSELILDFEYNEDGTATVEGIKTGTGTHINIPGHVIHNWKEYSVTMIATSAFWYNEDLVSVFIPNTITHIKDYAFAHCPSLKSINIPDSVITIDQCAFQDCTSLTSIIIPNSVTRLGWSAFYGCSNLVSVDLLGPIETIESQTFLGCAFESIHIPDSVTRIDNSAFNGCASLKTITIPNSVTYIGNGVFQNCTSITDNSGPDGSYGFRFSGSIGEWEQVEANGTTWHMNCGATQVLCENGTTFIDDTKTIFTYTYNEDGTATVDGTNQACHGCNVSIPDRVEYEGKNYKVSAIGDYVFDEAVTCPTKILMSVTIPSTITSIGDDAFRGCWLLTDTSGPGGTLGFVFKGTKAQWAKIHFGNNWHTSTPATKIQCSDGPTPLDPK